MTRSRHPGIVLFSFVAGLVGCDHATKFAAQSALRGHAPISVVPGLVDLTYTENRDVAFDALARLSLYPPTLVVVGLALAAIGAVVFGWSRRASASWKEHAAFALIVAGALGNVVDRLAHGHVVDFIHVHWWPVFNVADVLVVAGVVLMVLVRRPAPTTAGA